MKVMTSETAYSFAKGKKLCRANPRGGFGLKYGRQVSSCQSAKRLGKPEGARRRIEVICDNPKAASRLRGNAVRKQNLKGGASISIPSNIYIHSGHLVAAHRLRL